MSTIGIDLTMDQLQEAIRKSSYDLRMRLWLELDAELNPDQTQRRTSKALAKIWTANAKSASGQFMADMTQAIRRLRAERRARSS